jgi:pilus assembly protein CpaB
MGRRTILLIAAIVVAALGTVLVFLYAQGANDRATADNKPVDVLVATAQIASGTTGAAAQQANSFKVQSIPKSAVAPGALSSADSIQSELALSTIFVGQQILSQQWGSTPESTSSLPIPKGKIAISVQLGDPARVAGFVEPGSNVAIFSTLNDATQLLVPKVEVIAAGPTTIVSTVSKDTSGNTNTEDLPKALLTLAVDQANAQKIIFASQQGELYFGLLTSTSVVRPSAPTNATTLYR